MNKEKGKAVSKRWIVIGAISALILVLLILIILWGNAVLSLLIRMHSGG